MNSRKGKTPPQGERLSELLSARDFETQYNKLRQERRSGVDRRSGISRRKRKSKWKGPERRTGEERRSGKERRGKRGIRIPIFVNMSIMITILILLIISFVGFIVLEKEKRIFEKQLIRMGRSIVQIISTNAPDKLLGEEDLALLKLVDDIAQNEHVLFAMVTDEKKIIKAHSDLGMTDKAYIRPPGVNLIRNYEAIEFSVFRHKGKEAFLFEVPLEYQDVVAGYVVLALSKTQIRRNIHDAKLFFMILTLITVTLGIFLSLALSMYFSRPINELREAVIALGKGDFSYRAHIRRKDELGDLGKAINRMAEDLALKEKIEDSFGRYVAPEIVDMILAHPDRRWMRGARVNASVLFVDIRGFMSISEDKDPAWIVDLLNEYFKRVTDVVIAHGGYVDKFVGDEVMAVFGAPIANNRHADSAVMTAIDIQKAVRQIESRDNGESVRIKVGVGVNSGAVVAGNLGSEKRMEYTVIGDGVNVASRLTKMAGPDEILISRETYELMVYRKGLRIEERGSMRVKGRKTQVSVYNIIV
jgi:adenylate cyclase